MKNDKSTLVQEVQHTEPRFVSIAELMKCTTLSRPTINRHIKEGTIPAVKLGGRVLIVAEFLSQLKGRALGSNPGARNGS